MKAYNITKLTAELKTWKVATMCSTEIKSITLLAVLVDMAAGEHRPTYG